MKRINLFSILAATALSLASTGASAVPVFTQGPLSGGYSYLSSLDALQQNADGFTLAANASLSSVSWWGTATDGSLDGFTVRIFGDAGGEPGLNPLFDLSGSVTQTGTGLVDSAGEGIFRYDLSGTLDLSAGSYWFAVANTGAVDWFWLGGTGGDALSYFRFEDGNPWSLVDGDLAFSLDTAEVVGVPEPGTLALFVVGLAGVALARRRNLLKTLAG